MYFLINFFIHYVFIWITSSCPQLLANTIHLTTYPPNFMFLSLTHQKKFHKNKIQNKQEKISKAKQTNQQQNKTEFHRKKRGVCFVLTSYPWAWVLPWNVVDIPSDTPLEKTDFPFAIRQQLQMASLLNLCPLLPLGTLSCLNLCRS